MNSSKILEKEALLIMASHAFIDGCNPVQDALKCVDYLGGNSVVKAVVLTTQPCYRPFSIKSSEHWPIIIEVCPKQKSLSALTQIRVRNVRVGITNENDLYMSLGRSEWAADELLKSLGFDIPDLFVRKFCGDRFEKTTVATSS